ncbi:hypothetical protein [Nocardioides sp.]|uniref:hypothetical protein n=1 Tax=Nocardioides sp. TaxID=35761 RepID=UPI002732C658|nr:hypothetical protein [Nocardioides sp.]MDP3893546.1 hypothetical protein [Nocardioides sp.]
MTHEPVNEAHEAPEGDVVADMERVRTGDERVDAVIAAIEGLDGQPVDEHVPAFEQAHDELRRALDASPDEQA